MAEEFLCPKCRQPVEKTATFCGNCGFQLIAQPAPATGAAATATPTSSTPAPAAIPNTPPVATAPQPVQPVQATHSLAVPAKASTGSIHDIKGVKLVSWMAIILGVINTIEPILGVIIPDTLRKQPGYEKYSQGDFIGIAILALLLITPLIVSGIVLLRTHEPKRGRHWLIAMLVPGILFCISALGNLNIVGFIITLILNILAIRAYMNIRKYEKSAAPVTPPQ